MENTSKKTKKKLLFMCSSFVLWCSKNWGTKRAFIFVYGLPEPFHCLFFWLWLCQWYSLPQWQRCVLCAFSKNENINRAGWQPLVSAVCMLLSPWLYSYLQDWVLLCVDNWLIHIEVSLHNAPRPWSLCSFQIIVLTIANWTLSPCPATSALMPLPTNWAL